MAQVTLNAVGVEVLDGTQTDNTLIAVGAYPVRMATGDITGRAVADWAPVAPGQMIIIPPSLIVTMAGTNAVVWYEAFGE